MDFNHSKQPPGSVAWPLAAELAGFIAREVKAHRLSNAVRQVRLIGGRRHYFLVFDRRGQKCDMEAALKRAAAIVIDEVCDEVCKGGGTQPARPQENARSAGKQPLYAPGGLSWLKAIGSALLGKRRPA
jgi:hypothetical protein